MVAYFKHRYSAFTSVHALGPEQTINAEMYLQLTRYTPVYPCNTDFIESNHVHSAAASRARIRDLKHRGRWYLILGVNLAAVNQFLARAYTGLFGGLRFASSTSLSQAFR
jgi:hypothetical protein